MNPYARPMGAYEGVYINQQTLDLPNIQKAPNIAPKDLFILMISVFIRGSKRAPEGFLRAPKGPYRMGIKPSVCLACL